MTVAPGTKLESGPATLHLCNDMLVVARDVPPAVAGQWKLSDLRRYGAVPHGFILEGGTRCGYCKSAPAAWPRLPLAWAQGHTARRLLGTGPGRVVLIRPWGRAPAGNGSCRGAGAGPSGHRMALRLRPLFRSSSSD